MVKWREELHGQGPGFEDAVLLADEDAALAGDGEGLVGSVWAWMTGPVVSKAMGGRELNCGEEVWV